MSTEETYRLTPLGTIGTVAAGDERRIMDALELQARRQGLGAREGTFPCIVMDGTGWEFSEVESIGADVSAAIERAEAEEADDV